MCRNSSSLPGVVGSPVDDVAKWDTSSKIREALRLTTPKLPKEMQRQFADMLSPLNIGITVGVLGAWAASHAFGVGEIVDVLLFIVGLGLVGTAVFQCAKDLVRFVEIVRMAHHRSELDEASFYLARVIGVLGVTVFMAFLTKCAAKGVGRMRMSPGGAAEVAISNESIVSETASSRPQRTYEVLLPADKVLEGDGAMAEAMRKASLDDWYRNYPALDKWRKRVPGAKGEFETAAQKRASHMAGTDLSMPVIRRTLLRDTEIIQFKRMGGQLGVYLGSPGATPSELGILGKGRIVHRFRVVEPLEVLETTAAKFQSGMVSGVGGKGGGQQLIMPPDWERRVQKLW
jgi:hypothetical protein